MNALQKRLQALEQRSGDQWQPFVVLLGGIDELSNEPDVIDIAPPERTSPHERTAEAPTGLRTA